MAMWSGPRNISTAMMRAFENRPDTVVVDEPLYAAYLARTGIDHPVRDEVIASQPTDLAAAVAGLSVALPHGRSVHYAKHMAHHVSRDMDLRWTLRFRNVLLIRDPVEVVASYVRARETCEPDDIGLPQQGWLMELWDEQGHEVPVIDAGEFLRAPEPHLRWLCEWLGIPFSTECCPGRRARARPTACGRRTGTPPCGLPPGSSRGARGRSNLSDHDAAVAEACSPIYTALHARRMRF